MSKRARGKEVELFGEFFGGMRRFWWKATLLMLLNLAVGGLALLNFTIFPLMDMSNLFALMARSVTLFVGVLLLLVNMYAWHMLVLFDWAVKGLLESALRLCFAYPLWSIGVLIAASLPLALGLLLPRGILLIGLVSLSLYIMNLGTWRMIERHAPDNLLETL